MSFDRPADVMVLLHNPFWFRQAALPAIGCYYIKRGSRLQGMHSSKDEGTAYQTFCRQPLAEQQLQKTVSGVQDHFLVSIPPKRTQFVGSLTSRICKPAGPSAT